LYDLTGLSFLPYSGMVLIGATNVAVSANAGPGVAAPTLTGSDVVVQMFNTNCGGSLLPAYQSYTFTPGVAQIQTACTEALVGGLTVRMDTTAESTAKVVKTDVAGSEYYLADVSATTWLRVTTHLVISNGSTVLADCVIDLDYGRLHASTAYQPGSV
jgi:hypothetical protein